MIKKFKEIYVYREMLYSLVSKNLRSRYKASFLGFLWTFVNPVLQLIVYSFVFTVVFKVQIPNYAIFLFTALLPWTAFNTAMMGSLTCVVGNVNLVKKIYFPRMILPISTSLTYIVDYIFCLPILFFAILIFLKPHPTFWILLLPVNILLQFILMTDFALIFSSLNVRFRDMEQIVGILLLGWLYFTPILYSMDTLPEKYRIFMILNPMTGVIEGYRSILLYSKAPDAASFIASAVIAVVLFIIGYYLFNKLERTFAEEL